VFGISTGPYTRIELLLCLCDLVKWNSDSYVMLCVLQLPGRLQHGEQGSDGAGDVQVCY